MCPMTAGCECFNTASDKQPALEKGLATQNV